MRKVEICGINTSELPKLKSKQIEQLLRDYKNGRRELKEEIIMCNMRLILSCIKRYMNKRCNMDDVFQVGCIGLLKAVDNFDPTLNLMFSTYAVPMINGEIKRYLRDNGGLRISRSIRDNAYKILQFTSEYLKANAKEPSVEEIMAATGLTHLEIITAMDSNLEPISIFEPAYNDGDESGNILEQIADSKNMSEQLNTNLALKELLKKLDPRERQILLMRYYVGKTQMEVSEEVGISQAQVSRLEKNAVAYLKKHLI